MNESNNINEQTMEDLESLGEDLQSNMEILPSNDGLSIDNDGSFGSVSSTLSDGSNQPFEPVDADGDNVGSDVWTYNDGATSYSSDTGSSNSFNTDVCTEIVVYEKEQTEILTSIHGLLVLIFAFLLMEWTEKKINVIINRFTNRNR